MTRPSDEQPTTVLPQQTVEQPSVTTSAETRRTRTWHHRIPARIGRARSSTVIIGALFLLLGGLNVALPQRDSGTTTVVLENGQTIEVPNSALPSEARATPTPEETTPAGPGSSAPASSTGTSAPPTGDDEETTSTAPRTTAAPTPTPSSTRTTTSRAPSTSAEPSATAEETAEDAPAATGTADPTG